MLSQYLRRALWIAGRSSRLEWWTSEGFVIAAYAAWGAANRLLFKLGIEDWPTRIAVRLVGAPMNLNRPVFRRP